MAAKPPPTIHTTRLAPPLLIVLRHPFSKVLRFALFRRVMVCLLSSVCDGLSPSSLSRSRQNKTHVSTYVCEGRAVPSTTRTEDPLLSAVYIVPGTISRLYVVCGSSVARHPRPHVRNGRWGRTKRERTAAAGKGIYIHCGHTAQPCLLYSSTPLLLCSYADQKPHAKRQIYEPRFWF